MLRRLAVPLLAALILLLAILSVANAKTITPINPIPFKPGNCPFTVSPIVEKQGSEITLTFGFGSTPPAVTDWGDSSFACNGNECDIYVQVVGPQPPNCLVLWMAHKNTHTYTIPQGNGPITNICIFVNGNEAIVCRPAGLARLQF